MSPKQWFESVPIVQRLISRRRRHEPPPLIVRRTRAEAGPRADSVITASRSVAELDTPAAAAEAGARDPGRGHSSAADEAVRATLAGIAAELASSEVDGRSRRLGFALAAGSVISIVLVVFIVRSRQHDDASTAAALHSASNGEVAARWGIEPRPQAVRSIKADTSRSLSRATVAKRADARPETPRPTISDVTVSPSAVLVHVSRTTTVTATLSDEDGNEISGGRISWTSSKPQVATVSSEGLVRGRAAGRASITASSGGKKASALVVVTRESTTKARQ